jgi:hypothetical protein
MEQKSKRIEKFIVEKILTEKNIIIFLGILLFVTSMIDLYTAYTSPIFEEAETNPIYVTYGILPLTLITFLWMYIIWQGLKRSIRMTWIFAFVMACLFLIYGHILGAESNINATAQYMENPQKVLDIIHTRTAEQKIESYKTFVFDKLLIPYLIDVIGFMIFYYLFYQRKSKREKNIEEGIMLLMKGREL